MTKILEPTAPSPVPGIPLALGATTYVCPPLGFRPLRKLQSKLATFNPADYSTESLDLVLECAHSALKRNYPEITEDDVIDGLGLENMMDVMKAVLDVSGLRRVQLEAEATEATANPSTGTSSTPT